MLRFKKRKEGMVIIKYNLDNLKEKLEIIGAEVIADHLQHRLIVNNKYSYCYLNGNFFTVNGFLGKGVDAFLKFIQNDS